MEDPNYFGLSWLHGPSEPFTFSYYVTTVRGCEYLHLYLWVIKDLGWTQDWYYAGLLFGSLAVIWSFVLITRAMYYKNYHEVIISTGQLLWLAANLWWMSGELHDWVYSEGPPEYLERQRQAGYVMMAAMCWLGLFYFVVKPCKWLTPSPEAIKRYDDTGLGPRFPMLFSTWREYENIHIFFWLGKDLFWNQDIKSLWIVFVIPTLVIAFDFVLISMFSKYLFIDHMHYLAQILWVSANIAWAFGELYYPDEDYPYSPFISNADSRATMRWYSSWLLIAAIIVIAVLFAFWIPLTYFDRIKRHVAHPSHTSLSDKGNDSDKEGDGRDSAGSNQQRRSGPAEGRLTSTSGHSQTFSHDQGQDEEMGTQRDESKEDNMSLPILSEKDRLRYVSAERIDAVAVPTARTSPISVNAITIERESEVINILHQLQPSSITKD